MPEILIPRRPDPEWGQAPYGVPPTGASTEVLSTLPVFQTLTAWELRIVSRIVHRRHFVTGEVVLRAWVERSGLYVIQQGLCHVVRGGWGEEMQVVGELGPGALLGEFALLDGSPRSTSIVAAEPSDLLGFFRPDLMDLIETEPSTGFKVLLQLSRTMARSLRGDLEQVRLQRNRLNRLREGGGESVHA